MCAPAEVGGLEGVVESLAQGLSGRGHDVWVVGVLRENARSPSFLRRLDESGVRVLEVRVGRRDFLRERSRVRTALEAFAPDIVHTHGYRVDALHGGSGRRLGAAAVSTVHSATRAGGVSRTAAFFQERALRRFDAIISVSEELARTLAQARVPKDRIHVVANAWAPLNAPLSKAEAQEVLGPPDPGDSLIVWVGRLVPVKGCDVFIDALSHLPQVGWSARIVGDGPERVRLEARVDALGLEANVRFTGTIPDAGRALKGADLVVASSRSEGTPISLIEAMASGRAVVATAVGGVPGLVEAGTTGWLVGPEDPGALGAAIREALEHPGERKRRGQLGRDRLSTGFRVDDWIRRHERIYQDALQHRRTG